MTSSRNSIQKCSQEDGLVEGDIKGNALTTFLTNAIIINLELIGICPTTYHKHHQRRCLKRTL